MLKRLSFALFDTGETILGALVFSTFFPLYITQHIDTKIYSFLYGVSFLLSFFLALYLGKLADAKAIRKLLFGVFGSLTAFLCGFIGIFYSYPFLALVVFLLMALSHQQSFVFYNSLLLSFESKGVTSGLGVALGYVGSAVALIFLAQYLREPGVYYVVGVLFFLFLLPALLKIENPSIRGRVRIKDVLKDKRFILLVASILSVTEVANTMIAMMGIYLREVYSFENTTIYRIIGLSAFGGILGGFLWGKLTDRLGVGRVFPIGFLLWAVLLLLLPFTPSYLIVGWGFGAGFILSHVWTTSRVLILSLFPQDEASVRLSFLSLTERIASTSGLLIWSSLLFLSGDNYKMSAALMSLFPLAGIFLYVKALKI